MRQLYHFLLLFAIVLASFACRQQTERCIKGKVIRISCASFVVQVLNRDSVGSYGWRDINGHAVYNNVFNVANPCNIEKLFPGDIIYFTLTDSVTQSNCVTCRMYDAPPEKNLQIGQVSRKGCQ